jgi:hypothetical protein
LYYGLIAQGRYQFYRDPQRRKSSCGKNHWLRALANQRSRQTYITCPARAVGAQVSSGEGHEARAAEHDCNQQDKVCHIVPRSGSRNSPRCQLDFDGAGTAPDGAAGKAQIVSAHLKCHAHASLFIVQPRRHRRRLPWHFKMSDIAEFPHSSDCFDHNLILVSIKGS